MGARDSAPSTSWDRYVAQLREAYTLAKGEVSARARGRRTKLFDERGVHPFSAAWGRLEVLRPHPDDVPKSAKDVDTPDGAGEGLLTLLFLAAEQGGDVSSLDVLTQARRDAVREFIQDAKEGKFDEDTSGAAARSVVR